MAQLEKMESGELELTRNCKLYVTIIIIDIIADIKARRVEWLGHVAYIEWAQIEFPR